MHSAVTRLNTVFFFALLLLGACAFVATWSNTWEWLNPSKKSLVSDVTNINLSKLIHRHAQIRPSIAATKFEFAELDFSLNVDLREEFHWNTKEIFAWLTAEYVGGKNDISKCISLWDQLILNRESALFEMTNALPEYQFWDTDLALRDTTVKFVLHYHVHPWVGFIQRKRSESVHHLKFPSMYNAR